MKVKDIKEMIKNYKDDDELWFIERYQDRDGIYGERKTDDVIGIVLKDSKPIRYLMGNSIYIK